MEPRERGAELAARKVIAERHAGSGQHGKVMRRAPVEAKDTGKHRPEARAKEIRLLRNQACQAVPPILERPIPEGDGGIVVFGDLNLWGSSSYYLDRSDHKQLTDNLTSNGDRTGVVWYFGHNSWVGNPTSYFSAAISYGYLKDELGL